LPQEAIDKFGQKPRKVTPLHLGVNDYVQIMHGPYATSKGTVKQVIDHHLENPTAVVGFLLMGEKVEAKFQFSQLAKAF
jgi:transcription antitermination factor NusG